MAVYVKAVTYKGKPFFFVRMQVGKGSERKELCGPRHVTEEAAKRDKESLDGKPIDEQLAGVGSLDLLSHATQAEVRSQASAAIKARSRKARRKAESSSARAARLLKRRLAASKARRNETAEQKLLRNAAERVRAARRKAESSRAASKAGVASLRSVAAADAVS